MAWVGEGVSASSSLLGIFNWMEKREYHTEGQGTPIPTCHGAPLAWPIPGAAGGSR